VGRRTRQVTSPLFLSPELVARCYKVLDAWVARHRLGKTGFAPLDMVLTSHRVVQPDVFFVSNERKPLLAPEGIRGAPDLCVEVLSPHNRDLDCRVKRRLYARHGVTEYWIVDPDARTVEVWRLQEDAERPRAILREKDTLTSAMFPGLEVRLAELFAE
jgi:Uma2 family endonuclease